MSKTEKKEPNLIVTGKVKITDKNTGKEAEVPVEIPSFGINGASGKFALGEDLRKGAHIEAEHLEVARALTGGKTPKKI